MKLKLYLYFSPKDFIFALKLLNGNCYDCNIIKMEPNKNAKQEPELKPYTMDEINQMIDESLDDIKNGRVYTLEQVDKMMKEEFPWLK